MRRSVVLQCKYSWFKRVVRGREDVTASTKYKSNPLCRLLLFEDTKLKREEKEGRGKSNSIYTICLFALGASHNNCSCSRIIGGTS
jgi:hypothetical protein